MFIVLSSIVTKFGIDAMFSKVNIMKSRDLTSFELAVIILDAITKSEGGLMSNTTNCSTQSNASCVSLTTLLHVRVITASPLT